MWDLQAVLPTKLPQGRLTDNLIAKVPTHAQDQVKRDYWTIFDLPEGTEPGLDAVAHVRTKIDDFARRWRDSYPAAVRILLTDREALTHYLRTPREHWTRVRHSNFIERTFGETRRRVKVIGRLPGETSCVSLVWAVLDRSSRGARGFTMTPPATPAPRPASRTARPTTHATHTHTDLSTAEQPAAVGDVA